MTAFVVDTNVLAVANQQSRQADPICVVACVQALIRLRAQGLVLIDTDLLILTEYRKNVSLSGQPGVGDAFLRWLWDNQANSDYCRQVRIERTDDLNSFVAFPTDPDLAAFDPSDRKFVAVALSSGSSPAILNAVDSDWAEHDKALRRNGVLVTYLCPQHVSAAE